MSLRSTPADPHEVIALRALSRRCIAAQFALFPFELGFTTWVANARYCCFSVLHEFVVTQQKLVSIIK